MDITHLTDHIDNSIKEAVSKTAFYFESELSRVFQTEGRSLDINWADYKNPDYFQEKVSKGFSEKKLHKTTSLAQSFSHTLDGYKAQIGTPVKYAQFHEFGTSKFVSRPFFKPVLDHVINENIFSRFLKEALENG
ncbi:MAG: hypothetical protein KatS3mg068_2498 [Candidatus Sericytochromatia bacterium]|nr:MAG: hypothetical protein KatS3mg068_2498 [Candidatus Sericytochromatia bacterium]